MSRFPRPVLLVFALGVLVRIVVLVLHEPVAENYTYANDSQAYLNAAAGPLFGDPLHPAGYPLFLRLLAASPWLAVAVQHLLGVATAALLYLELRRLGVSQWPSLIPAAVVLLGGAQLFLEQAVLSEPLFGVLLAGALYACLRSLDSSGLLWTSLAGGLIGASATVRAVSLVLLPAMTLWLLLALRPPWRRRLLAAGASVAVGAAIIRDTRFV